MHIMSFSPNEFRYPLSREFLKIAKNDDAIKRIPIVVLTTSKEESDATESYNHGVAGYIVKPVDYKQFVEAMRKINDYWNICLIVTNGLSQA